MAVAQELPLRGPLQRGSGVQGQYVYALIMVQPTEEVLARGVKKPSDFDRITFREMCVKCLSECGVQAIETACFQEPHGNGEPHMNLLVRAGRQWKWKKVAQRLLQEYKVHISFAEHIKTWAEGVVYFRVASEHKGPEQLDQDPRQWHKDGCPAPFEDYLPRRWQQPGFVRATRLTNLAFYELVREHDIQDETELWAKATELSDGGDKGLLAYLMDTDAETQLAKVLKATGAQAKARRAKKSRVEVLEEYVATTTCCCATPGRCYDLQKEVLRANGLEGAFQAKVYGALQSGRAKKRNVCLLGDTDCGKTFLLKGLRLVYQCYERPEGGSYQLEDLPGKELVFLNDFEYDASAKDWMPWSYFKNFLEGGDVKVARPKNRGGNVVWAGTAPVFLTAPSEVKLWRYGKEDYSETSQMRKRIDYLHLPVQIPEERLQEVLKHCGHCSARVYLEGKPSGAAVAPPAPALAQPASADDRTALAPPTPDTAAAAGPPPLKKRRTASECLEELKELKFLLDQGLLEPAEFTDLKRRLLEGD